MVQEEDVPYEWPQDSNVPSDVLQLWTEVENGLEKNQTGACAEESLLYHIHDSLDRWITEMTGNSCPWRCIPGTLFGAGGHCHSKPRVDPNNTLGLTQCFSPFSAAFVLPALLTFAIVVYQTPACLNLDASLLPITFHTMYDY